MACISDLHGMQAQSSHVRSRRITVGGDTGGRRIPSGGEDAYDTVPGENHLARGNGQRRNVDRKSTRLNSSHLGISYAVFCLKKKKKKNINEYMTLCAEPEAIQKAPVRCD